METCLRSLATTSGEHIWKPNMQRAEFVGKSTDSNGVSAIFSIRQLPSASAVFRQLPPSSVSCRFGSLLVGVSDVDMSGGQDGAVGREYLETQKAMRQICGKNRPILILFRSFSSFRQLPSAPAIFRHLPFRVASGPCVRWQHVWGSG